MPVAAMIARIVFYPARMHFSLRCVRPVDLAANRPRTNKKKPPRASARVRTGPSRQEREDRRRTQVFSRMGNQEEKASSVASFEDTSCEGRYKYSSPKAQEQDFFFGSKLEDTRLKASQAYGVWPHTQVGYLQFCLRRERAHMLARVWVRTIACFSPKAFAVEGDLFLPRTGYGIDKRDACLLR